MRIGIVGWGVEGQSAYRYFGPGHEYLIFNEEPRDDFPEETASVKVQFNSSKRPVGTTSNAEDLNYLIGLEGCDKIIYSPTSVKNLEAFFGKNKDFWDKATTPQKIFFESVKTKNIIGITGTKGKGTTSTLTAKILEAMGKKVYLGGNIGNSVLDFANEVTENDWVVLELSSFQLYHFPYSPRIAVCLMISPEHLDWHEDFYEYTDTKSYLFRNQKKSDIAIYLAKNEYSEQIAGSSPGIKIPYFASPGAQVKDEGVIVVGEEETKVIDTDEIKLMGEHNWQNICAAVTAVWFGVGDTKDQQKIGAVKQVLTSFGGLPHRLEFVREINEVKYYDDSFGTTPETAIVAMRAFKQPKVLIVGGYDRGIPMEPLIKEVVEQRIRQVITMGQTGKLVAEALKNQGFTDVTADANDMPEAVAAAQKAAEPGDIVLLSAAATSFDMFKDFADRGDQFKAAVRAL